MFRHPEDYASFFFLYETAAGDHYYIGSTGETKPHPLENLSEQDIAMRP